MALPDNEEFFNKTIAPVVQRIIDLCKVRGMPALMVFEVKETDTETMVIESAVVQQDASTRMRLAVSIFDSGCEIRQVDGSGLGIYPLNKN